MGEGGNNQGNTPYVNTKNGFYGSYNVIKTLLEDTARYAGLLIMLFWHIFGNLWCPVVTLVTFSSNISNFERNPKKPK